jgi:hypothetical protein
MYISYKKIAADSIQKTMFLRFITRNGLTVYGFSLFPDKKVAFIKDSYIFVARYRRQLIP